MFDLWLTFHFFSRLEEWFCPLCLSVYCYCCVVFVIAGGVGCFFFHYLYSLVASDYSMFDQNVPILFGMLDCKPWTISYESKNKKWFFFFLLDQTWFWRKQMLIRVAIKTINTIFFATNRPKERVRYIPVLPQVKIFTWLFIDLTSLSMPTSSALRHNILCLAQRTARSQLRTNTNKYLQIGLKSSLKIQLFTS